MTYSYAVYMVSYIHRSYTYVVFSLQKDYDSLKIQHDSSLKDAEVKLRAELQQLRTELDKNWKNQIK